MKKENFVLFGGDYNPDQWDDETIEEDIKYFKEASVNTVSLPMFSWAKLEPKEDEYNFEWLDKILKKLSDNDINFFLATPTCAQPAWMSEKYPEVLPVDIAGRKRTHGMRVFFCVNSEKYRERAKKIAVLMSERYKNHKGLLGWHVANEYGTFCYCENCQKKFRIWLKNRYGTLDVLNEKWNTAFWGRVFTSFEQVMLPTELNDDYQFNPTIQLDYMRFVTDSTIECYENEAKVLKEMTPDLPVFTNISGLIKKLDQFKMVPHMDCAGWDNYPAPNHERSFPALKHNLMRATKDGQSYYVMEQSPNQQNWQPYNKVKKPGELKKIAFQGLAHGSDSSLYFQMRQSVAGQEKLHGAFISHSGKNNTRIFKECIALGNDLKKLNNSFQGGRINSDIGIMFDWNNWWAIEQSSGPTKDLDYLEQVHYYYKQFYYQNIPVDIIKQSTDFSKYKVIVAPLAYMLKDGVAKRLEAFVKNGGILISTYLTGYVDENDRCVYGAYPGQLKDVFGIWVDEIDALYPEEKNGIKIVKGNYKKENYDCSFLCDLINVDTAEVLAEYTNDFYKGNPVVTKNKYGEGCAYYLGSQIDKDFLTELFNEICDEKNIKSKFDFRGEIEITTRVNEVGEFTFIINHGSEIGEVDLKNEKYKNILNDENLTSKIKINPSEVLILTK